MPTVTCHENADYEAGTRRCECKTNYTGDGISSCSRVQGTLQLDTLITETNISLCICCFNYLELVNRFALCFPNFSVFLNGLCSSTERWKTIPSQLDG